jgi:ribosome-dependent ATPase
VTGGGITGWLERWFAFAWAFARREAIELARDKVRLAFALAGPLVLLCVCAYSISFDVQGVRMAVLDHDQSGASRDLVRRFEGTRYFTLVAPVEGRRPRANACARARHRWCSTFRPISGVIWPAVAIRKWAC